MSSTRVSPLQATTMYATPTKGLAPVPLPRPKSEIAIAPRRSLPPPPPAPHPHAALTPSSPALPTRPVPPTPTPLEAVETPAAPRASPSPKRALPSLPPAPPPANGSDDHSSIEPKRLLSSQHRVMLPTPPPSSDQSSGESDTKPHSWQKVLPRVVASEATGHGQVTSDKPSRPVPRPPSTLSIAPRPSSSSLPVSSASSTLPPESALPPPALPRRPTVSDRQAQAPTPAAATATTLVDPPQLPSRSDSVLKRIQAIELNHTPPPPVPPLKPRRVAPTVSAKIMSDGHNSPASPTHPARPVLPQRPPVPVRPAVPERPSLPERPVISDQSGISDRPEIPDRPETVDRPSLPKRPPVPGWPNGSERPSLPARPNLAERPSVSARTSPSLSTRPTSLSEQVSPPDCPPLPVRRPTLPERPALPKRPQTTTVSESHSSSHTFSQTRTTVTQNASSTSSFSSTISRLKSSASPFLDGARPSSAPLPPRSTRSPPHAFHPGDDPMAVLGLSKAVTTSEFCGTHVDYSAYDFTAQDAHAAQCPEAETQSLERLSEYLTRPFRGDKISQLRTIFSWIAKHIRYNMTGYRTGNLGDNSAEGVLLHRTGVCAGFSNLMMALAGLQDLGVVQVTGDARGDGFEIGRRQTGGAHAWNAVEVHGEWRLIDSTWGSGCGGGDGEQGDGHAAAAAAAAAAVMRRFMPYYFLMRPEEVIFTHWPSNPDEQFLDPPVCRDLYVALPVMRATAWEVGLRPMAPYVCQVLETENDFVELDIKVLPRGSDGATAMVHVQLRWKSTGTVVGIHPFWCQRDDETGGMVYSFRFYCPGGGAGELNAFGSYEVGEVSLGGLTYKVINKGTGANYRPPFQQNGPRSLEGGGGAGLLIVEPWTASVPSGVEQRVSVRVMDDPTRPRTTVSRDSSRPSEIVLLRSAGGGQISLSRTNMPTKLKQVEPGWHEMTQIFSPGEYFIGYKLMGTSYSFVGSFKAE